MAIIEFEGIVDRQSGDDKSIIFQWPRTGATITYTVSLDAGKTFQAPFSTITEILPNVQGLSEYEIPYSADERPEGQRVVYNLTDGIDSGSLYVNVFLNGSISLAPPAPSLGGYLTSKEEIERLFSVDGVDYHLEDLSLNETTTTMTEIVTRATETVLQFLRGRYRMEDMEASAWVRMNATHIGAYYLSIRRGNPALYQTLYSEAMSNLAEARDGVLSTGMPTPHRVILQTPVHDSKFLHNGRISPTRSSHVYSGQRLNYRMGGIYD